MNEVEKVIKERTSTKKYDKTKTLSEAEIKELISYAVEAPSSFDIQHWRFVAITKPEDKTRLKAVSYNQQQVEDAAVTFIVLGDLRGYEKTGLIWDRAVENGLAPKEVRDYIVNAAQSYAENEQMSRDEAIRSGSLAAMTLMLAAKSRGLSSGPMVGFEPDALKREFGISDRYLPVMLVTVGYAAPGNHQRMYRLPVDDVLAFDKGREF